jgi:chloramphenicol 3-O-phosphotransferase
MKPIIYIVTGAPGSGKTTALEALLQRASPYLAFDIDWLVIPASQLARSDIFSDQTTWPAYNALWFEFLCSVHKNGKISIFFSPIDRHDIVRYGQPAWCERIEWLLLDCDNETRQTRLSGRSGRTISMMTEALQDAQALREQVTERIDTGTHTPDEVATAILSWVERIQLGMSLSDMKR